MIEERDKMEKDFKAERDRMVLELKNAKDYMEKEKENFKLQQMASEAREAKMKEKIKVLLKSSNVMTRTFQAECDNLAFQLEKQKHIVEQEKKQCEELARIHQNIQGACSKCHEVQMIFEKENMLGSIADEVENLKESVNALKQKAYDRDPDMEKEVKAHKRVKNFAPQWFRKILKYKNMKRRQDLEKESEALELQLKEFKDRQGRAMEVINLLVKERIKMKNQLGLGVVNAYRDSRSTMNNSCNKKHHGLYNRMQLLLKESISREASSTEVINGLLKERKELNNSLQKQQEQMKLKVLKEKQLMEEQLKNQLRINFLEKEREAIEDNMVEKMTEQLRMFQAEKYRLKQMLQGMTEELEDVKITADLMEKTESKEGHKKTGWRNKAHTLVQCFQNLFKKDKVHFQKRENGEGAKETDSDIDNTVNLRKRGSVSQ